MSTLTSERAADTHGIAVQQVVKAFGAGSAAIRALDGVSVDIRQGEFFTLLGPSGCGKTTLLRLIAGFEMPTSGAILLDGADISALPPNRRPVNTVFQSYALFPHLSVAENIGFGLKMMGRSRTEVADRVARMLALIQLEPMASRRITQLSGGQQQRVALARALAPQPKVLLLDEPLSALDAKLRKEMQAELKRLQQETGITFVFVTHDQEEALTMSDRIAVMSAGHIQQVGTPREVYTRPVNRFVASFVGETNFISGEGGADGVRLGNGAVLPVSGAPNGPVTVAIRPEHLMLCASADQGAMAAVVERTVYSGTDTHCHLKLAGGGTLTARLPTLVSGEIGLSVGDKVHVRPTPGAVQLLAD